MMFKGSTKLRVKCLRNVQVIFCLIFMVLSSNILAFEKIEKVRNDRILSMLNPYAKIQYRAPANFVPNDDVEIDPFERTLWIDTIIVEDDKGVLKGVISSMRTWEEIEEYATNWNLESTGLYDFPNSKEKRVFLEKNTLKYLDKRLSGEIKYADEGSTMQTVGKVHKALRPSTQVGITRNFRLRFKARLLQLKGRVMLENPYFDLYSEFNWRGEVQVYMSKNFEELGLNNILKYNLNDENWEGQITKRLTNTINAVITSIQTQKEMLFSSASDKTFALTYTLSF